MDDPPDKPRTSGALGFLSSVGKARDGVLVIIGAVYALGYVVRSLHAWRENLGVVPALDSQYFLAGVLPAIVFLVVYLAIRFSGNLADLVANLLRALPNRLRYARIVSILVVWIAILVINFKFAKPGSFSWSNLFWDTSPTIWQVCRSNIASPDCPKRMFATLLLVVLVYLQMLLALIPPAKASPRVHRGFEWYYPAAMTLLFGVCALVLSYVGYRSLPQELGGLRPEMVNIEMLSTDVSGEGAVELFGRGSYSSSTAPQVLRSFVLEQLSSQGDYLIVRPALGDSVVSRNYRIRKELVRVVSRP